MLFNERFSELVSKRGVMARLSEATGISTGLLCNYKKDVDPSLTNAIKIANFFNVSLDWLAGRSDDMEIKYKTAQARVLVDGFESLNVNGKAAIMEQLEFQQSRNSKSMSDTDVSEVA